MPTHDVELRLPSKAIRNADVSIAVSADGARLGELRISKGTIDWQPARRQKPIKVRWERFAALMDEEAARR